MTDKLDHELADNSVGLALSGGGFRAGCFGLGAILYLADAGRLADVSVISSVSGGSITNAYLGLTLDADTKINRRRVWEILQPLAQGFGNSSLLNPWAGFFVAVLLLAYPAFAIFTIVNSSQRILGVNAIVVSFALLVVLAIVLGVIFRSWMFRFALKQVITRRIPVVEFPSWLYTVDKYPIISLLTRLTRAGKAFRKYHEVIRETELDASALKLSALSGDIDHVICATDLSGGDHLYLSGDFVYSWWRNLSGSPRDVGLIDAVRASAAFPGVFAPVRLTAKKVGLDRRDQDVPAHVRLGDGGLFDNLGVSWFSRIAEIQRREPDRVVLRQPTQLMVVNALAPQVSNNRLLRWPGVGWVAAVIRQMSIVHATNTMQRVDERRRAFSLQELSNGNEGCVISINDNPYQVLREVPTSKHSQAVNKATIALDGFLAREDEWSRDRIADLCVRINPGIKTHLKALRPEGARDLLLHGYLLAMVHGAAALGWDPPASGVPPASDFLDMCRHIPYRSWQSPPGSADASAEADGSAEPDQAIVVTLTDSGASDAEDQGAVRQSASID